MWTINKNLVEVRPEARRSQATVRARLEAVAALAEVQAKVVVQERVTNLS